MQGHDGAAKLAPGMSAFTTPEDLLAHLARLGITTGTVRHDPLFTVEESRRLRGSIPGTHCKTLFLKDKKGQLWLVVAEEEREVDLKRLPAAIGSARLSFGRPELLWEVLGVRPGSVTPFALINDRDLRVRVVLDAAMMEQPLLNYHPLTNEATTTIRSADLLRFKEVDPACPNMLGVYLFYKVSAGVRRSRRSVVGGTRRRVSTSAAQGITALALCLPWLFSATRASRRSRARVWLVTTGGGEAMQASSSRGCCRARGRICSASTSIQARRAQSAASSRW